MLLTYIVGSATEMYPTTTDGIEEIPLKEERDTKGPRMPSKERIQCFFDGKCLKFIIGEDEALAVILEKDGETFISTTVTHETNTVEVVGVTPPISLICISLNRGNIWRGTIE